MPPRVLAGEKIGYLRVRPVAAGKTQIQVGGAKLDVEVADDPSAARVATFAPRIVSPASSAYVWGDFSVGVEQMTLGDPSRLAMPVLRLPNGREITGHVVPDEKITQYGRWVYDLKSGDLAPGRNTMIAVGKDVDGHDELSNEIEVNVVTPSATASFTGFCRDENSVDRPYPTGDIQLRISEDKDGHGKVVQQAGAALCLPVWVDQPGLYQLFLTARGQIGGDGLPSISVSIDETGARNATASRLPTTEWRRVPVGHPVPLEAGGHVINIRLGNQFRQGDGDFRCMWLDKYELARIELPHTNLAGTADGGDPTLPMTGAAPMTMSMMEAEVQSGGNDVGVAFADNIDGKVVAGPVDFNAQCWWPGQRQHVPPPKVELYVNGKLVATQNVPRPRFVVGPAAFVPGANTLQLRAVLPSGAEGKSVVFTVTVPKDFPLPSAGNGAAQPPRVTITYAPQEVGVGKADAVVARVQDGQKVPAADLVIDGQAQHLDQSPAHGFGSVVLPLLTSDLKPGLHRLKVVARNETGQQAESPEMTFNISGKAAAPSRYERAIRLLDRLAYGPEPGQLAAVLSEGEVPWLTRQLAQGSPTAGEKNQEELMRGATPGNRAASGIAFSAIQYLLSTNNPVRARLLMWTENHFSTWIRKDGPVAKSEEHENFQRLGPAPFFDLLFTSATSPAMLVYLDQVQSFANRLNENYAREIMELHTLGVKAGYTQTDVTTLANLLTGWTLSQEAPEDGSNGGQPDREFGYDPQLNNGKECRIFGLDFPAVDPAQRFDRAEMALEMLTAHPSCAHFISRKLCEEYVADPAPPEVVDAMARVYLETGGDISAMLTAMIQLPGFWSAPAKIANPIDFSVRLARLAGRTDSGLVYGFISASGMGMFERATPDGYPEDDGYSMSTNSLLQRWHFSQNIAGDLLHMGIFPPSWHPPDTAWDAALTQRMIDFAAIRITGNPLGAASNEAAQKLVSSISATTDARLRVLAAFICQAPENSLK